MKVWLSMSSRIHLMAVWMMSYRDEIQEVVVVVPAGEPVLGDYESARF